MPWLLDAAGSVCVYVVVCDCVICAAANLYAFVAAAPPVCRYLVVCYCVVVGVG